MPGREAFRDMLRLYCCNRREDRALKTRFLPRSCRLRGVDAPLHPRNSVEQGFALSDGYGGQGA